jgi:tRNA threonylcarbamoyl adenosine modification protein YeaZ
MIVLALDTSGVDCSACVYDSASNTVLGEVCETIGKGHAERLMAVIDGALQQAQLPLQKVERIAVTIGPGSFTGIRVGVAAARGFALSLGIEAVGVTTLETIALHHLLENPGRPVAVGLDAKRGEAYLQTFSADGTPLGEAALLSLEDAKVALSGFDGAVIGSAAPLFAGSETGSGPDHFPISTVARAGGLKPKGMPKPAPLYLRGPDARPQTGFALARQSVA